MGFPQNQVKRLICIHKITDISEAVSLLTKDEIGLHKHYFTPERTDQDRCYICGEGEIFHYEKNPRTTNSKILEAFKRTPSNNSQLGRRQTYTHSYKNLNRIPEEVLPVIESPINIHKANELNDMVPVMLPGGLAEVIENENYCNICYEEMEEGDFL